MKILQGKLDAFSETGTEGVIWCLYEHDENWNPKLVRIKERLLCKDVVSYHNKKPIIYKQVFDKVEGRFLGHSFEYQHVVEFGDHLVILNDNKTIKWQGKVKYTRTSISKESFGEDNTISPEEWIDCFNEGCYAFLIKNEG